MKPTEYEYRGEEIWGDVDGEGLALFFGDKGITLYFSPEEMETILKELEELVAAFK